MYRQYFKKGMKKMKVPFVSFLPMEKELNQELHDAFERVLHNSQYIDGQ